MLTYPINHPSLERFFYYLYEPVSPLPPWADPTLTDSPPPAMELSEEARAVLPTYELLEEEEIGRRLKGFEEGGWVGGREVGVISFQPVHGLGAKFNEDRSHSSAFSWPHPFPSCSTGTGMGAEEEGEEEATLLIVLDGHLSPSCVDHTIRTLPEFLKTGLIAQPLSSSSEVEERLRWLVKEYDRVLLSHFLDLFPGGWGEIERVSGETIERVLEADEGRGHELADRCISGACLVAALVVGRDVWVVGLGDCEAVLGYRSPGKEEHIVIPLTSIQNCSNPTELALIHSQHPSEPELYLDGRYLGWIICTRALGDCAFKFPRVFGEKVLPRVKPYSRMVRKFQSGAGRIISPPYISTDSEVRYHRLPPHLSPGEAFLMLSSDGWRDMPFPRPDRSVPLERVWVEAMGELVDRAGRVGDETAEAEGLGLAGAVLRKSWERGNDRHLASAFLGLKVESVDDVTLMVCRI